MKRILIAILATFYITTATGANLHFHYCMGEFAGWSFWQETEHEKCGQCGMEKKEGDERGCCKDEYQQVKIKVDQKSNDSEFSQIFYKSAILLNASHKVDVGDEYQSNLVCTTHFTPPWSDLTAIYIRCCNYRI